MDISTEELEQFLSFSPGSSENASEEKEAPEPEEDGLLYEKTEEQFSKVDAFWEKLKNAYDPKRYDRKMLEDACAAERELLFHLARRFHPLSSAAREYLEKAVLCRKEFEEMAGPLISRITAKNIDIFQGILSEDIKEDIEIGRFDAIGMLKTREDTLVGAGALAYELYAPSPGGELVLLIRWLYVDEEWRSRGVANALLGELVSHMASLGIAAICVDIPALEETSQVALDFFDAWHFSFSAGVESELVVSLKDIQSPGPFKKGKKDARSLSVCGEETIPALIDTFLTEQRYTDFPRGKELPEAYFDTALSCFTGPPDVPNALMLVHRYPSGKLAVVYAGCKEEDEELLKLICQFIQKGEATCDGDAVVAIPIAGLDLPEEWDAFFPRQLGIPVYRGMLAQPF